LKSTTFTSFFKDKKSQRSHKTAEGIKVFLNFFLFVDGRILILTNKLRIRIQVAKTIRILRIWIRGTLRGTDLKNGSGSWQADGLLHQPVQDLVGQVIGRPNKNKTVLRISQISGELILESELFKGKKNEKKS
jgi:hypothetical protein